VCVRGAAFLSSAVAALKKGVVLAAALCRIVLPLETIVQGMAIARKVLLPSFSSSPRGRRFALTPGFPRLKFTACWRA